MIIYQYFFFIFILLHSKYFTVMKSVRQLKSVTYSQFYSWVIWPGGHGVVWAARVIKMACACSLRPAGEALDVSANLITYPTILALRKKQFQITIAIIIYVLCQWSYYLVGYACLYISNEQYCNSVQQSFGIWILSILFSY